MCMNYDWVPINSTCRREAYIKIFHLFVISDVFQWRNTLHTIVGVQQLGQIKDSIQFFYITVFLFIKTKNSFSADWFDTSLLSKRFYFGIYRDRFCNEKHLQLTYQNY